MIKRDKSIELLNKAIAEEMTAINQYMYFHLLLEDMGYDYLAKYFKRTSISEMIHVEKFGERILFLKGEVEIRASKGVEKIHDVKAMLEKAVAMETETIINYNAWARECMEASDSVSKQLFESILVEEEEHQDQFDTEVDNMNNFGDNYLALQSIEHSKNASKGISET